MCPRNRGISDPLAPFRRSRGRSGLQQIPARRDPLGAASFFLKTFDTVADCDAAPAIRGQGTTHAPDADDNGGCRQRSNYL